MKITRWGLTTFLWWRRLWCKNIFYRICTTNYVYRLLGPDFVEMSRNFLVRFRNWDGFMWPIRFPFQIHRKSVLPIPDFHISVSHSTQNAHVTKQKHLFSLQKCPLLIWFSFFSMIFWLKKNWAWNCIEKSDWKIGFSFFYTSKNDETEKYLSWAWPKIFLL